MQPWIEANIQTHRKAYTVQGVVCIIFGIVALLIPALTAEFFAMLVGALLVAAGILHAYTGYSRDRHYIVLFSALAFVLAGVLLLIWPNAGILVLSAIIGIFLLVQGVLQIATAAMWAPFYGWIWMLASGIVSLSLSLIVYAGWPITGLWLLGVLIGVNLLFFGVSLLMIVKR